MDIQYHKIIKHGDNSAQIFGSTPINAELYSIIVCHICFYTFKKRVQDYNIIFYTALFCVDGSDFFFFGSDQFLKFGSDLQHRFLTRAVMSEYCQGFTRWVNVEGMSVTSSI